VTKISNKDNDEKKVVRTAMKKAKTNEQATKENNDKMKQEKLKS